MGRLRTLQTNLQYGQLDPAMLARSDTAAYQNGAATLTNSMPRVQGGNDRRPGTRFLADLSLSSDDCRMEEFRFNNDTEYLVIFVASWFHVYSLAGALLTSVGSAPWGASDIAEMTITQAGDTMLVAHNDWATQKILRTTGDIFTLSVMAFEVNYEGTALNQPYFRYADGDVYITPTLVGPYFLLTGITGTFAVAETVTGGTSGATSVIQYIKGTDQIWTDTLTGVFVVGEVLTGGTSGATGTASSFIGEGAKFTGSDDIFVASDEENRWRIGFEIENTFDDLMEVKNYEFTVEEYVSATVSWVTMQESLPTWAVQKGTATTEALANRRQYESMPWWTTTPADTDYIPSDIWQESAFSDNRGYPGAVAFHNNRLFLGGNHALHNWIWASGVGAYFNFSPGEGLDDEGFDFGLGSGLRNKIKHITSEQQLLIWTDLGLFYVPESLSRPLTPSTAVAIKQNRFGVGNVVPQFLDDAMIYIDQGGATMRQVKYQDLNQSFQSQAMNLTDTTNLNDVRGLAVTYVYETRPEQFAVCVNGDGTAALFHGNAAEQVAGWFPWDTDGEFLDVASLDDRIFAIVKRNIDSTDEYFLEEFERSLTVDCAKQLSGTDTTAWTGLTHLPSTEVQVVEEVGGVATNYGGQATTTAGGDLTTADELTDIVCGLYYERVIKTMPFSYALKDGTIDGSRLRMVRGIVQVMSSIDVVMGSDQRAWLRNTTDDLSLDIDPVSNQYEFRLNGWTRTGQITIEQELPLPLTILGLTTEIYI